MVPGVRYTVSVSGEIAKHVDCEGCGREYGYVMRREGVSSGVSYLLINRSGVQEDAARGARASLMSRLRNECDEVPCPACGHYQDEMIPLFQRRQLLGMWYLALGLVGLAAVVLMIIGPVVAIAVGNNNKPSNGVFKVLFFGVLAAAATMGLLRRKRVARIDPNEVLDEEVRKKRGKRRAMNRKQFLLAFYPERLKAVPTVTAVEEAPLPLAADDDDEPMTLESAVDDDREDRRR